jgi:hypothetical protein
MHLIAYRERGTWHVEYLGPPPTHPDCAAPIELLVEFGYRERACETIDENEGERALTRSVVGAALEYASRGWPVFPCKPKDKKPLTEHGFKDATTDATVIAEWWRRWPSAMIGVPMGERCGMWAIDPDGPENPGDADGVAEWEALVEKNGVPPTRTHRTPSGGRHILFRWRPDQPVTNSTGNLPKGIDVRGEGGYVIMPPSRRADGREYELIGDEVVDAPEWVYDIVLPEKPKQHSSKTDAKALDHGIRCISGVGPTDFACHMEQVARVLLGEPNGKLSNKEELRFGTHGSVSVQLEKGLWYDFEKNCGGGVLDLIEREMGLTGRAAFKWMRDQGIIADDAVHETSDRSQKPVATYDYVDESEGLLFQVCRYHPKRFLQRRPKGNGWVWSVRGARQVPYRLPDIVEAIANKHPIFIVEGEKDADNLWGIGVPATCNAGGANKWKPELNAHFRDADVVVLPDRDVSGWDHAQNVAQQLADVGARVRVLLLPDLPEKGDVSDWLEAGGIADELNRLAEQTQLWSGVQPCPWSDRELPPNQARTRTAGPYEVYGGKICWMKPTNDGKVPIPLCNFTARITKDIKIDDGSDRIERCFIIEGNLGHARVPAERFDSMSWVTRELGCRAILTPGPHHKDHLAAAIKNLSTEVKEQTVYAHLGWRKIGDRWVYLHAGGAIGAEGHIDGIEVDPGPALRDFVLPVSQDPVAAVRASLDIVRLLPPAIGVPLFSATYRAPLGEFAPITSSLYFTGTSGTLKTSLAKLAQAHWGAYRAPANWASTANALERLAFLAKDALLLVDDFAPRGTQYEIAKLHASAERLMRGQANRTGRQRMNADSGLRPEYYPRGLITGTGEDVPSGHSLRARMVVDEISKGDVELPALTRLQNAAEAGILAEAMACYVAWVAKQEKQFAERERELRASARGPHARTPENVASLMLGMETALKFATEMGAVTEAEAEAMLTEAWSTLLVLGDSQATFLTSENPAERFITLVKAAISSGRAHIASTNGDQPTEVSAGLLGWREAARDNEGQIILEGKGPRIGWIDKDGIYLDPDPAYAAVQELGRNQQAAMPLTQNTLWKRLDERGLVKSKDEGRHTIKKTICGSRERVIHFAVETFYEKEPLPAQPKQEEVPF